MYYTQSFIGVIVLWCLSCSHGASSKHASQAKRPLGDDQSVFNLDSLVNKESLDTIPIRFDCVTKKINKRYLGVATKTLFSKLIQGHKIDTTHHEVIFLCKDGYSASVPFYQLLKDRGFVVVRDVDAKLQWDAAINDQYSPCYLVWDLLQDDHNHSFPYGITHIHIVNSKDEYANAFPTHASLDVFKGFSIFKNNCIKCHAINQVGGEVGPELNIPMNVTEYWKNEQLQKFILHPSRFRINSKMPTLTGLTTKDSRLIVEYLKFMAKNKK